MSSCVYVGDYEEADFYSASLRRARKEYRCCECDDTILPGDLHEYVCGRWDGLFATYRTCARCVNIRADYFPDGWLFGSMAESWQEAHGFDYRDGIPEGFAPCL